MTPDQVQQIIAAMNIAFEELPKALCINDPPLSIVLDDNNPALKPFRDDQGPILLDTNANNQRLLPEAELHIPIADLLGDGKDVLCTLIGALNEKLATIPITVTVVEDQALQEALANAEEPDDLDRVTVLLRCTSQQGLNVETFGWVELAKLFPDDVLERIKRSITWPQSEMCRPTEKSAE